MMNKKNCLHCGFMGKDCQQHVQSLKKRDRKALLNKDYNTLASYMLFCELGEWDERVSGDCNIRRDHEKVLIRKCKNFIEFRDSSKTFASLKSDLQRKKERSSRLMTATTVITSFLTLLLAYLQSN